MPSNPTATLEAKLMAEGTKASGRRFGKPNTGGQLLAADNFSR